jgi:hypothetical protein
MMNCKENEKQKNIHWQNSPFLAIAFLRRLSQICLELDHPVFTSFYFATIIVLQNKVASLAPPNLEDQVSVFMSPNDRLAQ